MNIKTITCHDVYNHGASLQAYALMTYLSQQGHDVEIIDYKPDYLSGYYNLFSIDNPKWEKNLLSKILYLVLKVPMRIPGLKRKRAFDNFTVKYLKITSQRYHSNESLKNNLPNADAYICGSDQIWNSLRKNGRDRSFYLDFVPNTKIKLAYAASFATDTIAEEFKPMVKELVSKLDGVGVREISGVGILNDLGITNAVNVLDPVFLLDKELWNELGTQSFNDKYVLVYDFDRNPLIKKIATDIANQKGYKIYSINNYKSGYEDKVFQYSGPEIFVSLVKNAEYVVSNSFHAVVFSLIYQKQLAIVNRTEAINTRMRDLLHGVNLGNRVFTEEDYILAEALKKINYSNVQLELNKKIEFSKEYLTKTLQSVKGKR